MHCIHIHYICIERLQVKLEHVEVFWSVFCILHRFCEQSSVFLLGFHIYISISRQQCLFCQVFQCDTLTHRELFPWNQKKIEESFVQCSSFSIIIRTQPQKNNDFECVAVASNINEHKLMQKCFIWNVRVLKSFVHRPQMKSSQNEKTVWLREREGWWRRCKYWIGVIGEIKTGYKCGITNERKNDVLRTNSNSNEKEWSKMSFIWPIDFTQ